MFFAASNGFRLMSRTQNEKAQRRLREITSIQEDP
jgi:hypothetical protein